MARDRAEDRLEHQTVVLTVPASFDDVARTLTVEAAKKEGKLIVYATTDAVAATPLVKDFEALYPGISVEYSDLNSTEVYNRFISESAAGSTADFIWSSAMDLQVKLVAEGKALDYASPEIPNLPKWAVWKNEAYGTTHEPIAFVYNKRIVPAAGSAVSRICRRVASPYGSMARMTTPSGVSRATIRVVRPGSR